MPYDHDTFCLAIGMLIGMIYYSRTGWACGGIITPGVVAIYISDPVKVLMSLAVGLVVWGVLEGLVRLFGIYGRQRLVTAMFVALALRYPMVSVWGGASLWLGWVVPGLIGADMQRQGIVTTVGAVVSTSIATAMCIQLLQSMLQ